MSDFGQVVLDEFSSHAERMRHATHARRAAMQLRAAVVDNTTAAAVSVVETLGVPQATDLMRGDTNLRTLRTLLSMVDDRGFERSPHQIQFHSAFERCTARVIYKRDWATSRPAIMKRNGWDKCSSEVMISTPRRFGKTFACVTSYAHVIHNT